MWLVWKKRTQKNLSRLEKLQISNSLSKPRELKTELSMLCLMFHTQPNHKLCSAENPSEIRNLHWNNKSITEHFLWRTSFDFILKVKKIKNKNDYWPNFYWSADTCSELARKHFVTSWYLFIQNQQEKHRNI